MEASAKPTRKQNIPSKYHLLHILMTSIVGVFFIFSVSLIRAETQVSDAINTTPNETPQQSTEPKISDIQSQLETKKKKINELKSQITKYEQSIRARQREAVSLTNQISILNDNILKAQLDIELTQNQIEQTNIEIRTTEQEIENTQRDIDSKKELLSHYLNLLFRLERKKSFETILENKSLSDFFIQQGIVERIQDKVRESKQRLDTEKRILETKNNTLQNKKLALVKYSQEVEIKRSTLEQNKYVRTKILLDTKNSEQKFRMALQDLKEEQNEINADIVELEKAIRLKVQSGGLEKLKQLGSVTLTWPVANLGITAFFHDPDYPFRYIFEHPAIDIRAPQGTPIRAPAPGFVGRVRDGGKYGYSYLMIVHNDGISTVYGHVSGFNVVEDQFVNQGDIIAFTGGRPGTRGAGRLTTGPHLHFEVRVNGIPVDPLEYLP